MFELAEIERVAAQLMAKHLEPDWQFGFDRAKTRAGLCNHRTKRISVSKYIAPTLSAHDLEQLLLHEIGHALAGHGAGHGPKWRAQARAIGYTGGRTYGGSAATELASWVGHCPGGHVFYRFKRPQRFSSCKRCHNGFSYDHLIKWQKRSTAQSG